MNEANETRKTFDIRPCYTCCHPNAKGTGSTVRFELHPAHDTVEGSVFITFATQKTIGSYENGQRILPTFDWANRVTVRLSLNEVAQMLEVFRGYREKMCDGNGLFHRTAKANTIITLEVMLCDSPLFFCMDGTIRDLAALRGTYRIIPETEDAIRLLLEKLRDIGAETVHILLDEPVSNSGRLKALIADIGEMYLFFIDIQIRKDVDRELYGKENVITSDSVILDNCLSWINLTGECLERRGTQALKVWDI